MKIFITLDYELYFGERTGGASDCLIEPTMEFIRLAEKHGVGLTFFVDTGYLLKLDEYAKNFPALQNDLFRVTNQLEEVRKAGHSVQLHIHPSWADCYYDGDRWIVDNSRFSLFDFPDDEISEIVTRNRERLASVVGDNVFAHRAGGWCLQPFDRLMEPLRNNGLWLDSSVYPGGLRHSKTHSYDFINAPDMKSHWKFGNDPLVEKNDGYFTEVPISSIPLSPFFYYRYALAQRFKKEEFSSFGKGTTTKHSRSDLLQKMFTFTRSVVSIDGYKASLLSKAFDRHIGFDNDPDDVNLVLIGHPKATTRYSLKKLEEFIEAKSKGNVFPSFDHFRG